AGTRASRRGPASAPPASCRTDSFRRDPPPRFVVVRLVERRIVEPLLRLVYDAPAFGHFGRVVGAADFVMKQLTARVPQQFLKLRRRVQQPPTALPVQLLNPLGQGSEQRHQALRALRTVDFFAHRDLPGVIGNPRPPAVALYHTTHYLAAPSHQTPFSLRGAPPEWPRNVASHGR